MYAWWSDKMCAQSGYVIYLNAVGEKVKATFVNNSNDRSIIKWDDLVPLGEVTTFVESHITVDLGEFGEEISIEKMELAAKQLLKDMGHTDTCKCELCFDAIRNINSMPPAGLN